MPTPRHGIGAALLAGGIHIPGGGPIENFSVSDVHEVLDTPAALGAQVPLLPLLLAIALGLALAATGRRAR